MNCKHCHRSTRSSDDVARAQGWRWYSGPTMGGGHLDDVVCPVCAGTVESSPEEFIVGCSTCDWVSAEDGSDETITTWDSAKYAAREHECEPEIWISLPGDETQYPIYALDGDGNPIRTKVRAS